MSVGSDFSLELQLRPSELSGCLDIPHLLLEGQSRLQNYHILCPADGHGLSQHFRCVLIGAVKLPHPAQVPGREARNIGVSVAQVLRRCDSSSFLWPAADQPANLAVQFHLRQICRHQRVQCCEHCAVVYGFSDVHRAPPFRRNAPVFIRAKKNAGDPPHFSLP